MPIRDGFDREAMERKIEKNRKNFSIIGMKIALREELKSVLKSIRIREERASELSDQIAYMDENYK